MSISNVKAFRTWLAANQDLQGVVRNLNAAGLVAEFCDLAGKHGFEFTADELDQVLNEGELSSFELEMVSGGAPSRETSSRRTRESA